MRRIVTLATLLVLATPPPIQAAETVDETLGTGEVMAFGLNTYIVYLEISELLDDTPSWVLGTAGLVVGGTTLALKDYDGTVFSSFQTIMAATDLLMGGFLVMRANRGDEHALRIRPHLQLVEGQAAWGCALSFRF